MTAPSASFSAPNLKRLIRVAKEAGLPVEKMGLFVDGERMALLPADTTVQSLVGPNPLDRVLGAQ